MWANSYLGKLRARVGDDVLLFVSARIVVRDSAGRVLLIRRADNGRWALPAGAMELGESIAECAGRELFEETGLAMSGAQPFAMYTSGAYTFTNEWDHTYQLFAIAFVATSWSGELVRVTDETTDARFADPAQLPEPYSLSVVETLADLAVFERTGKIVMK